MGRENPVLLLGDAKHNSTCFIFDEPSTGLHMHDEVKLLHLLEKLVSQGNSVLIIEHNPKILAYCDWIIELDPHGGPEGGHIIATGIPEELCTNPTSLIGPFLSSIMPNPLSNILSQNSKGTRKKKENLNPNEIQKEL